MKLRLSRLLALPVLLLAAAPAAAHEDGHERPSRPDTTALTDPHKLFPFLVLSGGGAHFHALLLTPDLKTFFAGTHFGLFRSNDRGINWRLATTRFDGDDVRALARDPKTGSLYLGTHRQGVFRSPNGGAESRLSTFSRESRRSSSLSRTRVSWPRGGCPKATGRRWPSSGLSQPSPRASADAAPGPRPR